jgi:hypothetical protein
MCALDLRFCAQFQCPAAVSIAVASCSPGIGPPVWCCACCACCAAERRSAEDDRVNLNATFRSAQNALTTLFSRLELAARRAMTVRIDSPFSLAQHRCSTSYSCSTIYKVSTWSVLVRV